jgi:phosphohistidine phosphatase
VSQLRTGGIAVVAVQGEWADADTTSCSLTHQHTARAETGGEH